MSRYDFTTLPNRLCQKTIKWHDSEKEKDLLPLWIADMDFMTAPEIRDAVTNYARNDVYGYPQPCHELFQSIIDWEKNEHGYCVSEEKIVLIEAVVPAISTSIQALTNEGDTILINTPVYPPFARSIKLNHRKLISNSLLVKDGIFKIDFEALENDIIQNNVKMYVLCNPHNPGGRVWTKDELYQIGKLCEKYHVILISDEIHQDLVLFGHEHHSLNTVDESFKDFTIILGSATKTFNIAGTKNSFAIIENDLLRKKFKRRQLMNNQHEVAAIGLIATEAAFSQGKPWLTALKPILEENITYAVDYLRENTDIIVMKPQGTYLIWLDFSLYGIKQPELHQKLVKEAKVILNDGSSFGNEGSYHARLNVAAPLSLVKEAVKRIAMTFIKLSK